MPAIPPLNLNTHSSADGKQQSAFDNSGFSVSIGKGGGVPGWLVAALVIGAVLWVKHGKA